MAPGPVGTVCLLGCGSIVAEMLGAVYQALSQLTAGDEAPVSSRGLHLDVGESRLAEHIGIVLRGVTTGLAPQKRRQGHGGDRQRAHAGVVVWPFMNNDTSTGLQASETLGGE